MLSRSATSLSIWSSYCNAPRTMAMPSFIRRITTIRLTGKWVVPGGAIADYLGGLPGGFVSRADPVDLDGFHGSAADYPERFKKYLMDGKTANTSPHKGMSCLSNDLIKQLRMRRVEKLIVAGPVGNLCLEHHVRDLSEAGFEI